MSRMKMGVVLVATLMLSACATSRSYMSLDVPAPGTSVQGDKVAILESVTDERVFEADPDDPSTPSLKKGADYSLDAEGRKSAIARKRNGYGMAIGDIMLSPPTTVETLVEDLVTTGLQQKGYRVVQAGAEAPEGALRVKVRIKDFWAWLTPGFWALDMEARIQTLLDIASPVDKTVEINAYGKKTAPTGREDNWREAYGRAFDDYLTKQDSALDQAGL